MPDVRQQPQILPLPTSLQLVNTREDASHREWLRHVYPFYLHDLSQFERQEYHLSPSGHWEPDHLPYWLGHAFCHPFVLLSGTFPVGFAFIGQVPFPFMSEDVQFRLSEFFVLRAYRRSGIGRRAALAALASFAGSFELTVLEANAPALAFWRAVLPQAVATPIREATSPGLIRFTFTSAAA
jgi:predicted acetyltransferase